MRDGVELLVAHGGDGTVNEVVNGCWRHRRPGRRPARTARVVGIVPGGSANVFARALGVPRDPMEATARLLEQLGAGRSRLVGLGHAQPDDARRWFTFNAGHGLGRRRRRGGRAVRGPRAREATPLRYAATGLRQYLPAVAQTASR